MFKRNIHVKKLKRGQSTIEYIILVAGIIGALIVFLKPNGAFYTSYGKTLNAGTNGMENMGDRLSKSRPTQ